MALYNYAISYFDGRGRAEVSRCLLQLGNIEYVDDRFSDEEFEVRIKNGAFAGNFGQVPVLTYYGTEFGQSRAIERFLAKKIGYFGQNEVEELNVDIICEHIRDVKDKYAAIRVGKSGAELAAAKADYFANILPGWYDKLESALGSNGVAVGSHLSLADVYLFNIAYDFFDAKAEVEALNQSHPKVKASADKIHELLKGYLAKRPVTDW